MITETKHIPANCDMPLTGRGRRRCKWAGIVKTEGGRMVCGHHAKMIAQGLVDPDPGLRSSRPKHPHIGMTAHAADEGTSRPRGH